MLKIKPETNRIWLKYTLIDPVSHHDPGQGDRSNFAMFRRQQRRIKVDHSGLQATQAHANIISERYPVPIEIVDWFDDEPLARFVATCIAKVFITSYSSGEGFGLFSGIARYRRLEERMMQTAARVNTLKSFWSILCHELKVPPRGSAHIHDIMPLLVQPKAFAIDVLSEFSKHASLIRMLAQAWTEQTRLSDPDYAERVKKEPSSGQLIHLDLMPDTISAASEISVAVPLHSGNDIRHDIRQSLMYDLLFRLDINFDEIIPLHIRTLLENGGALSGSAPANAFQRQQIIRENYPHLSLLGGCMDTYMLGESRLQSVSTYFKGKENNDILAEIGISSKESIIDLLDLHTLTRHATLTEDSPLPYEFEVIQPGAELYIRLQLHPFTKDIEIGALATGLQVFEETEGTIGGQSAQGFGRVKVEYIETPDNFNTSKTIYEKHINDNYEKLREGLFDGTLGAE